MVVMKDGDWFCLQCRNLNFAAREDCRHCGAPRTNSPEEESPEMMMDAEAWLDGHDIDEDKLQQFLELSEDRQQIIILKGPLKGCRDPTAVLVSRLNALPPDPELSNAPQGEHSGKVKSYSVFKAFGFIFPENDGEPDIFLHLRGMVDGTTPSPGDSRTFDLEPADNGVKNQMKAVNVRGGSGYPITDEQKGKDKDKGKGKGKGRDEGMHRQGGKGFGRDDQRGGGSTFRGTLGQRSQREDFGHGGRREDFGHGGCGREGPYGKGGGGGGKLGPMHDPYGGYGCAKGFDGGKGGYGGKGYDDMGYYGGKGFEMEKGGYAGGYHDMGKGGYPGDYHGGCPGGRGKRWVLVDDDDDMGKGYHGGGAGHMDGGKGWDMGKGGFRGGCPGGKGYGKGW